MSNVFRLYPLVFKRIYRHYFGGLCSFHLSTTSTRVRGRIAWHSGSGIVFQKECANRHSAVRMPTTTISVKTLFIAPV